VGPLREVKGTTTATIVSSALFGVWHVLPSLGLAANNRHHDGLIVMLPRSELAEMTRGEAGFLGTVTVLEPT
jgi:membrane protease YdiL (CAAX protease family)